MNSLTIAGQLGKDAEIRNLPDGTPVLSFSVADSQGREKPTLWWNCQLYGKRGESLKQYMTKGQAVTVTGKVELKEYNAQDGTPRKSMDVRVQDVALQGGKREEPSQPPRTATPAPAYKKGSTGSGFDDLDSDIPF